MVWGHQQSEKDQPFPKADFDDLQLLCVSLPVYPSWLCFHKRRGVIPRHPRNSWGTYYEKSHLSHMKKALAQLLILTRAQLCQYAIHNFRLLLFASKVLSEKKNSSPLTTTSTIHQAAFTKLMIPGTNHWTKRSTSFPAHKKTTEPLRSVLRCDMQRQVQGW